MSGRIHVQRPIGKKKLERAFCMSQTALYASLPASAMLRMPSIQTPSSTYSTSPTDDFLTPVNQYFGEQIDEQDETVKLADVLAVLDYEHESCIFIVRRISKLGFAAFEYLNSFFGNFGSVKHILLLPSRGKGDSRSRPASMGFVVMHNAVDCMRICQRVSYRVGYSDICVQKFVRNTKLPHIEGYTPAPDMSYTAPRLVRFMSSEFDPTSALESMDLLAESMLKDLGL